MAWATGSDVVTLTGHPADEEKLAIAQGLIEILIKRTEATATDDLSARDLEWLRRAVVYQAVWLEGQDDIFTRLDVTQLTQDGMQATFKDGSLVYGPLVKAALGNLSWRSGTRTLDVEPFNPTIVRRYPVGGPVLDYDFERWHRI